MYTHHTGVAIWTARHAPIQRQGQGGEPRLGQLIEMYNQVKIKGLCPKRFLWS